MSRKLTSVQFWRQNRLDLAEHMFSKLQEYRIHHSLDISQNLAGACYRIGNWALSRNDAPTAIIWLDRALQSIEYLQTCQQIPPVENCMRLAIQQALGMDCHPSRHEIGQF